MPNVCQHNYLTVPLPPGWEDNSQVIAMGPEDGGYRPNLVFSREQTEPGETAAAFAARQLPQLRQALPNYSLLTEGDSRFGPNVGFRREHAFKMEHLPEVGQVQFYVVLGNHAYTFTFTHLRTKLDETRALYERMFAQARLFPVESSSADDF